MNLKLKDMFKFTTEGKKSKYPYIRFSEGKVYATNGRVCLISKMDYPELYECSTRDKKFEYIVDAHFPDCSHLVILEKEIIEVPYNKAFFKRALDFYEEHKDSINIKLFETQFKIDDTRSFYLGADVLKLIWEYLGYFPDAKLFISSSPWGRRLQFESYKKGDSIFDMDDASSEVESRLICMTDGLCKEQQTIYTNDDKLYIAEDSTYNLLYKGLIERSNLENSGFIDMEYMQTYFKKYNLPDACSFTDVPLSIIQGTKILDIMRFDDYLHRMYGSYDKGDNAISMKEMFIKLFGDDAKIMASFFGVREF